MLQLSELSSFHNIFIVNIDRVPLFFADTELIRNFHFFTCPVKLRIQTQANLYAKKNQTPGYLEKQMEQT
uniref:Bm1441, isoform a n=1 Tax=Brugia malayi TaxID=6279 RepID=A0A0H5S929_BRUMA|nr:Bm1441, isoform a [Brugia malayi]